MLTSLKLINYRGFERHELPFRPTTIVVGQNNAGKSTLAEALRLVSIISARYMNLSYREPPSWTDLPLSQYGVSPDLRNMYIDFDTMCYEYRDPPTIINASFANGSVVNIYIGGENKIHAIVMDTEGRVVRSRTHAKRVKLPRMSSLPQIGPLNREETVLSRDYIQGSIDTPRASLHFRNQLRLFNQYMREFRQVAEKTWPGLLIKELTCYSRFPGTPIFLEVRCDEFVGDVGYMGHGLQMWLQTIWFLVRSRNAETIILDEPDVYLHADLQRRLLRHIRSINCQIILTTHSTEIISDVTPNDILIIDRRRDRSDFADSIPAVQQLIENVGSTHNIHLLRLWNSKRFIMIEGKDLRILKHIHDTIFPNAETPLDSIPNMQIGGWGGWSYAIGSSLALKNSVGESIECYCILDRDYHLERDIKEKYEQAEQFGINLHIWKKKEIENYLLNPTAITRLINSRFENSVVTEEEVLNKLVELSDDQRNTILDGYADELSRSDRRLRAGGANKKARLILQDRISSERGHIDIAPSKILLSQLSRWCQGEYGFGISSVSLARELSIGEITQELMDVISAIEKGEPFNSF